MDDYKQRLEDILAEWDLDKGREYETMNMSSISLPSANDTITISSSLTSPYTYTGAIGTNFPNTVWTTQGTTNAKINLSGDNADIEVNGWSLVSAVKRIEERLGLFQPNPELEAEWADLKRLGDRYRKLEQRIKDKQATWNRLKAMPKPDID